MYIVDARHFLDEKGAIGPRGGPAKKLAEFWGSVISYATDFDDIGVPAPNCFKCKRCRVDATLTRDDAIRWSCSRCRTEELVSNWQGTLWDLSDGGEHHA
jgi:ribosomal protein L37AE/L43A